MHESAACVDDHRARNYRHHIVTWCRTTGHWGIHPLALACHHLQPRSVIYQQRDKRRSIDVRTDVFAVELVIPRLHIGTLVFSKYIEAEVVIEARRKIWIIEVKVLTKFGRIFA